MQAHIDRARAVNGVLHAIVADRYAEALEEADQADASEPVGPLHGVPCTIKESFALQGMPWSAGLWRRRDLRAEEDAIAVARLRAAGAIPIGVTNTSEACMWLESHNHVYGRTNNPYDPRRIAGGSSGGEGAIIGAGASPFGLGSDIGGSIRMPAFFNGVFGHKCSSGLIPNAGQYPAPDASGQRLLSTGPLCRRAEDLPLLVDVLRGPDSRCSAARAMPLRPPPTGWRGRVVFDVRGDGRNPVHRSLRIAQRRAAQALSDAGAEVRPLRVPALRKGLEIWSAAMSAGNQTPFAEVLSDAPFSLVTELLKLATGRSRHTLPAVGLVLLERVANRLPKAVDSMVQLGGELREELAEHLGDHSVMLYPSYAHPAPRHGATLLPPTRWVYTALLNALEMPATQVPLGLEARGLPVGVQVAAAHGCDHLSMAAALELERRLGGWVRPSHR